VLWSSSDDCQTDREACMMCRAGMLASAVTGAGVGLEWAVVGGVGGSGRTPVSRAGLGVLQLAAMAHPALAGVCRVWTYAWFHHVAAGRWGLSRVCVTGLLHMV
jgi:hypothetical protein